MSLKDKILGKRKSYDPRREKLHSGPVIIQDGHVSPEMCERELKGTWDDRKEQCIIHEDELPDGKKSIGSENVKIIRNKDRDIPSKSSGQQEAFPE